MSVKKRCMLAAVTAGLWVGWLACLWAHGDDTHHPMHWVSEGIRTLFVVAAVSLVLACLLTPMCAAVQLGRQIGKAEQRRECGCQDKRGTVTRIRTLYTDS